MLDVRLVVNSVDMSSSDRSGWSRSSGRSEVAWQIGPSVAPERSTFTRGRCQGSRDDGRAWLALQAPLLIDGAAFSAVKDTSSVVANVGGMDSAPVLRRFAQEREALARLAHPHIARLLDAGANAEGLPFLVMEFVDGEPIDRAAQALPQDDRLALSLQLADAVAHAHRNLLLHRDL